jgi:hypothetical protein
MDNVHPTDIYNSVLSNVDTSSKIWIHRPDKSNALLLSFFYELI